MAKTPSNALGFRAAMGLLEFTRLEDSALLSTLQPPYAS